MNSHPSPKLKTVVIVGIMLVVAGAVAVATWMAVQGAGEDITVTQSDSLSTNDTIRHEHAVTLANRLFVAALVQRQSIPQSQAGLDVIATSRDGDTVLDPMTNKPYVYTDDQSAMRVGEAYFRTGASCDNKVVDSGGEGLIVDSIDGSIAVTIKLESDGYACQSSL